MRSNQRTPLLAVVAVALLAIGVVALIAWGMDRQARLTEQAQDGAASADITPFAETAGVRPEIPSRRDGSTFRVTYLGTSLGYGYFATSDATSYQGLLTAAFEEVGPVEATRAPRRPQPPGALTLVATYPPEQLPEEQDLFVIELGTNDAGKGKIEQFEKKYQRLIASALAGSPDALIVCLGAWQEDAGAWEDEIKRACLAVEGRYVPLSDLYVNDSMHGPEGRETQYGPGDVFHPNDKGHAAIAERVLSVLPDVTATPGATVPSPYRL